MKTISIVPVVMLVPLLLSCGEGSTDWGFGEAAPAKFRPQAAPLHERTLHLEGVLSQPIGFNEQSVVDADIIYTMEPVDGTTRVIVTMAMEGIVKRLDTAPQEWTIRGYSWSEVDSDLSASIEKIYALEGRSDRTTLDIVVNVGDQELTLNTMRLLGRDHGSVSR